MEQIGDVWRKRAGQPETIGKYNDLFGKNAALPQTRRRTERGDLIDEFYARLKPQWDETHFGKLTPGYLRWKLAKIPTKDLYYIRSVCNDAKNYAKTFFWLINPKKHAPMNETTDRDIEWGGGHDGNSQAV